MRVIECRIMSTALQNLFRAFVPRCIFDNDSIYDWSSGLNDTGMSSEYPRYQQLFITNFSLIVTAMINNMGDSFARSKMAATSPTESPTCWIKSGWKLRELCRRSICGGPRNIKVSCWN
jgi:hypothetical protein